MYVGVCVCVWVCVDVCVGVGVGVGGWVCRYVRVCIFFPLLLLYTLSSFDAPSCIIAIIIPLDLLLSSK